MRKRSMILALAALVIGMSAAVTATASAAKPTPIFTQVDTAAYPVGDDCLVLGQSVTDNARWVSHTLTVNNEIVGDEVVRVTGDIVAELMVVIDQGANTDVTVSYDTYILPTAQSTEPVADGSLDPHVLSCEFPDPPEPYLDGQPEAAGRYWNAEAVAGEYPNQHELSGLWTVDGQDSPDPGVADPLGGPTVQFRYDGISKKTDSVTFTLLRNGIPLIDVNSPIEISR